MKKVLNWGIIGCGVISKAHCGAIESLDNVRLYAVCDIIKERAEEKAEAYHADKVYTDYIEMLKDPNLDVVSICTPSGMHGEMSKNAADHGKHIFLEKPIEITSEKLDDLVSHLRSSKVKTGCVFQRRYDAKFAKAKEAVDSGIFGKLVLADAYMKYYRSPEYYKSGEWRATWELDGGGALMNQGVHGIDLLTWIAGDVESVFARCRTQVHDINVEDTAIASLQFKNGAVGNIEGTTCVYPAQDTRIELHFEKGTVIVSDAGILEWSIIGEDVKIPEYEDAAFAAKDDPTKIPTTSHTLPMKDLADAIIEDKEPSLTPEIARKSVDLILAIYKSSNEKREIKL